MMATEQIPLSDAAHNIQLVQNTCYHCLQPIPNGIHLETIIDQVPQAMCCAGCQSIAETIVSAGLSAYYQQRDITAVQPTQLDTLLPEALRAQFECYEHPQLRAQFMVDHDQYTEIFLVIDGLVCAACVWLLERGIQRLSGIKHFHINYSTHRAHLQFDRQHINLTTILLHIHQLGYQATPFDEQQEQQQMTASRTQLLKYFAIAAVFSMQVMMLSIGLYFGENHGMSHETYHLLRWANLILSIPCVTYAAGYFYRKAWRDLQHRRITMDVNVSLAIILGTLASIINTVIQQGEVYFDSVTMFAFLLLGARLIELNARHHALRFANQIFKVKPKIAHRYHEEQLETVPMSQIKIGDILLVKPGETIPADGILCSEIAQLDESLRTGESHPVLKTQGDILIGGAVNLDQALTMSVTVIGAGTVLSEMIRLIDRAMSEKPYISQVADRISQWFVYLLLSLCMLTYAMWLWIDPTRAFEVSLSLLVISCPCALALATPSAISASQQMLVRYGILPTRGRLLTQLHRVTDVIFDKTGTLTTSQPTLSAIYDAHQRPLSAQDSAIILQYAAALEATSNHPLARAVMAKAKDKSYQSLSVSQLEHFVGFGIRGNINGMTYAIGKPAYFDPTLASNQQQQQLFNDHPQASWVVLICEQSVIAYLRFDPHVRADSQTVIQALSHTLQIHLLSGDQASAVFPLASHLGIVNVQAECTPVNKRDYVIHLQQQGKIVLMVGDGLNDAPVLAQADLSIAMNQGAQLAQLTADMLLLGEQLHPIVDAHQLAQRTQRIIYQNLAWALAYNLIAIPIAMSGIVVPWMAALGMSMSSLIVVANTLRLRETP